MTIITVSGGARGISGISLAGHAGYGRGRRDIVCAAISALACTCENALETVARVTPITSHKEKTGEFQIALPAETGDAEWHDAQTVFLTVLQGFRDIAEQYPRHLRIIDGRNQL